MEERAGAVTSKGKPLTVLGKQLKVGDKAPDFTVVDNSGEEKHLRDITGGRATLISVVPSLDTGLCDAQTRRFNEEAAKLGEGVTIATISVDLPSAQKRWCGAAGIENVKTYSDHRLTSFGNAYGVHIKELRLLQRSIFVVDGSGTVRYIEYVPEIGQHPKYDQAIAALKATL